MMPATKKENAGSYFRALQKVITKKDEDAVKRLLEASARTTNIQKKKYVLSRALSEAARHGNTNIVTILINHGADVTTTHHYHSLCNAIIGEQEEILQTLINHGAGLNTRCGCWYNYPICAAASIGNLDIVKLLIKNGADVNPSDRPEPLTRAPLLIACEKGNEDVARTLIMHGARLDVRQRKFKVWDLDPLDYVAQHGLEDMARIMLTAGTTTQQHREDMYISAMGCAEPGRREPMKHERILKMLVDSTIQLRLNKRVLYKGLQVASKAGLCEIVSTLLANGVVIDSEESGAGPLYLAADEGRKDVVKILLEHSIYKNPSRDTEKGDALRKASEKGFTEIVQNLLAAGTLVDIAGKDGNALYLATEHNREEVVKTLLLAGATVDMQHGNGIGNALHLAATKGNAKIAQNLLEYGSDINARNHRQDTALHLASTQNGQEIIQILLDHGADISARNAGQETALHVAAANGHAGIVEALIDDGAAVGSFDEEPCGSPLYGAASNGFYEVVDILVRRGASVNALGGWYGTILQTAANYGYEKIVRYLISQGALPNLQGGHYGNALQAASVRNDKGIAEILLEHGADANANGGRFGTALRAATEYHWDEIVKLLLDHGAHINTVQDDFGNALLSAASSGSRSTVEILLEHGANINCREGWYGNPLETALILGYDGIADALIKKGARLPPDNRRAPSIGLS